MPEVAWRLPDRVLVTGAAGAIGGAIARRLGALSVDPRPSQSANKESAGWCFSPCRRYRRR
jgi:nucleoside-diphosphate-sugar epimerase